MLTNDEKKILKKITNDGSLHHFYLRDAVIIHNENDEPLWHVNNNMTDKENYCSMQTFTSLKEKGFIEMVSKDTSGWPYYANNDRSNVYKITKSGKSFLEG